MLLGLNALNQAYAKDEADPGPDTLATATRSRQSNKLLGLQVVISGSIRKVQGYAWKKDKF